MVGFLRHVCSHRVLLSVNRVRHPMNNDVYIMLSDTSRYSSDEKRSRSGVLGKFKSDWKIFVLFPFLAVLCRCFCSFQTFVRRDIQHVTKFYSPASCQYFCCWVNLYPYPFASGDSFNFNTPSVAGASHFCERAGFPYFPLGRQRNREYVSVIRHRVTRHRTTRHRVTSNRVNTLIELFLK